jgi:AbrB family looped-hinge helix DNA binding protein
MTEPLLSRLTAKGRATIPAKVRRTLGLGAGDLVAFELANGMVTVRKAGTVDCAFLKMSESAFNDWNSPEDDAAFHEL